MIHPWVSSSGFCVITRHTTKPLQLHLMCLVTYSQSLPYRFVESLSNIAPRSSISVQLNSVIAKQKARQQRACSQSWSVVVIIIRSHRTNFLSTKRHKQEAAASSLIWISWMVEYFELLLQSCTELGRRKGSRYKYIITRLWIFPAFPLWEIYCSSNGKRCALPIIITKSLLLHSALQLQSSSVLYCVCLSLCGTGSCLSPSLSSR